MDIHSFFSTYFSWNQPGFNFINTITYAVIALVLLFVIYKALNKVNVKFDLKFFIALFPFILVGSGLRALVDNKYIEAGPLVVTPGIYLLTAALFFSVYVLCFFLGKKFKFKGWKACGAVGIIIFILLFGINQVRFTQPWIFFAIIGLAIFVSVLVNLLLRILKQKKLTKKVNFLPVIAHMVDASATFIAVDFFGAWEKHPLTRHFTELTGTAAILYMLKLLIVIPAVYLIATEIKDKNFRNYLLIALATLGLAEGLRDALTLILI